MKAYRVSGKGKGKNAKWQSFTVLADSYGDAEAKVVKKHPAFRIDDINLDGDESDLIK